MTKQFTKWFTLMVVLVLTAGNLSAQIWQMGYTSMTFTDPSRGNRQIPTEVIYPADVAGPNVPWGSPFDQKYPVVVFGHDEGTPYFNYQYIWDNFAPKGFIIVMPLTEMGPVMNVDEFAKDLAFIASKIKDLRYDPASFFYKRHNSKSCIMGHGKGGSAAIVGVQYYPAVTTMIALNANETGSGTISAASQVTMPAVIVAGGEDCVSPVATVQEAIFNAIPSNCKTFMNFTTIPRCTFAQEAGSCTATQVTCGGANPYAWQAVTTEATWVLVSFMRFYMKSNSPALDKFEWKLQQKTQDFLYVMSCAEMSPRMAASNNEREAEFEDAITSFKIDMYPNPAITGNSVKLMVQSPFESHANLMITDMIGKVLLQKEVTLNSQMNELNLATENLRKGSYLVTIIDSDGRTTMPLVIN
jgi:Secretion system C-terminal sorting domain